MRIPNVLSIVWHSVEPDSIDPRFLDGSNPTVSLFREHIKFLVANYTVISVREFLELRDKPTLIRRYRRRPILLTFDDGFKNVIAQALPVLEEFGIPALFFVLGEVLRNPAFIPWYVEVTQMLRRTPRSVVEYSGISLDITLREGHKNCEDLLGASIRNCKTELDRQKVLTDLAALLEVNRPKACELDEDLQFIKPDDLAKLNSSSRLTVGSHAMTHNFLASLSYGDQENELEESHELLSKSSSAYFPALAYPGGSFNTDTIEIVQRVYKCAFSLDLDSHKRIYAYPRIPIGQDTPQTLAYAVSYRRLKYILPVKRLFRAAGLPPIRRWW